MSHISVHVRMRPIRFAFLVRPNDYRATLEIFRVNTCLWGGKYNPIIPFFKQVPQWWDRHKFHPPAARIINGYLDFFEPDFVVEAEPGLAKGLGFNKERVLQLSDILTRDDDRDWSRPGLTVLDLYRDLYRKEFQFARRHEHDIINVVSENPHFTGFCECLFGGFPVEDDFKHFSSAYEDAFDPKKVTLNGASLARLYETGFTSALRIGHSKIQVDYHDYSDPALFILDAKEPRDLIDYWNLRAVTRYVIPIPVQWIEELSEFGKNFILSNYRPLPGNQYGVMIHPRVMFSRSIPTDEIKRMHTDHFTVSPAEANLYQDWYPSWDSSGSMRDNRPFLSAAEKTLEVPVNPEKPEIPLECIHPEFADEFGNEKRWANVVKLRDWTWNNQIATVYPCDYRDPSNPRFTICYETVLPTSEGFVFFPRRRNLLERWELVDGTTAIKKWLKTQEISTTMSDAGRATQQIIQTLGGFGGVASLADAGIVKLLNKISRSVTRTAHHDEFKNRIKDAAKGSVWRGKNCFDTLVKRGAVDLGLELKCTKCSSWSWYSLKELDYNLNCSLCLRKFDFPITAPSTTSLSRWAYRLTGPFALPDYARGGYAASLAIRFFSETLGGRELAVTWAAGQELELSPKSKVESDFVLWCQRKESFGYDRPTKLVFGEAKSFGNNVFQADDIERMKKLAVRFAGAALVFATMKQANEISSAEIASIAKLAEWGREYIKEKRHTRAPVIVLTGNELFATSSLRETWKKIGGRHAELINHGMIRPENLSVLASLTQQLYLNMPPYGEWLVEKKKRKRRELPSP